ncbi:lipase [Nocardia tenerifensis]|uniref:lipase n=1 Tax=Nocardia tenerifensis TaxID=228006 RepID=UPI0011B35B6F|nr:lipase [Nocardia tenerifensis]
MYRTIDPDGHATTASGLLALPDNGEHDLKAVAFAHGTMADKADAPSVSEHGSELAATITYASAGFAGVTPDYLGLGLGPGPHPYSDVPSETTAYLDMLRAARAYSAGIERQLSREVYITGFSQGGPAAMNLARTLRGDADDWFRAAAVAAISGPFDIQATELPALLNNSLDPTSAVFYIAYFLVAWNRLHNLYQSPGEVFQAPYDTTVTDLFDGSHGLRDIVGSLPASIDGLLTPHALDMLRNPVGSFATALRVADDTCRDWTPGIPIRLYTSGKDRDVVAGNSVRCQALLRDRGVDASIIDVGEVNHLDSNRSGTAAAARWFLESHPS